MLALKWKLQELLRNLRVEELPGRMKLRVSLDLKVNRLITWAGYIYLWYKPFMKSETDLQNTHQEKFLHTIHPMTKTNQVRLRILDHLVYNSIDQGRYRSLIKRSPK